MPAQKSGSRTLRAASAFPFISGDKTPRPSRSPRRTPPAPPRRQSTPRCRSSGSRRACSSWRRQIAAPAGRPCPAPPPEMPGRNSPKPSGRKAPAPECPRLTDCPPASPPPAREPRHRAAGPCSAPTAAHGDSASDNRPPAACWPVGPGPRRRQSTGCTGRTAAGRNPPASSPDR